ncbi:protein with CYTH-like phosphatase domain [Aeromonas phage CF8]|nr:protein with CYTH-like phosphatase domain [Aeromonas phage CF8]
MKDTKSLEIERKWMVTCFPKFDTVFYPVSVLQITQFYNEKNERFRETISPDDKVVYKRTVKQGEGLVREEVEETISLEKYLDAFNKLGNNTPILKTRYKIPFGDFVIELDEFDTGELYAEIEFSSEEQARSLVVLPDWFGEEVTEQKGHDNFSIFKQKQLQRISGKCQCYSCKQAGKT